MEIIELNVDNIEDYEEYLGADVSESIGREYYRGIVASEDGGTALGALIWEYKNYDDDKNDTKAEICFVNSESKEAMDELLAEFDGQTSDENVSKSFFEAMGLSEDVKGGFSEDGFDISEKEGRDIIISIGELKAIAGKMGKIPPKIMGLDKIMEVQFMQGVTNCLFTGKKGIIEDLEYIEKDWFEEELSCCTLTDGKVSGMLLVHAFPSGYLMPVFLSAIGPDSKKDLLFMIVYSAKKALEKYPEDTRIILRRHNDMVKALTGKLFAGKTGEKVIKGNRE